MTQPGAAEPAAILFLCFFPDLTKGGQRNLFRLVSRLDRRRFRPVVVIAAEGAAADAFREVGARVHVLPLGEFRTRLRPMSRQNLRLARATVAGLFRLRRLLVRERVRVAYADGPGDAQYLWVASRGLGLRTVWHVQTSSPDPLWDALLARRVDRIVGVSNGVRGRLEAAPGWRGQNFTVVHNGVEVARFHPGQAAPGARERLFPGVARDEVLAVCVGQVVASKGMEELVAAVAASPSSLRVAVLGHGEPGYVALLEEKARAAGVSGRLRFAGFCEGVEELLPAADLFVLPTYVEGLSLAVLEAMASGLPIVTTDIPGNRELVLPGTGVLVPPRDSAALARALADLSGDADRRKAMGGAGRRLVESSFTLERYVERFEELFEGLCPSRPGRAPSGAPGP